MFRQWHIVEFSESAACNTFLHSLRQIFLLNGMDGSPVTDSCPGLGWIICSRCPTLLTGSFAMSFRHLNAPGIIAYRQVGVMQRPPAAGEGHQEGHRTMLTCAIRMPRSALRISSYLSQVVRNPQVARNTHFTPIPCCCRKRTQLAYCPEKQAKCSEGGTVEYRI